MNKMTRLLAAGCLALTVGCNDNFDINISKNSDDNVPNETVSEETRQVETVLDENTVEPVMDGDNGNSDEPTALDSDNDGILDEFDLDDDKDGVADTIDAFPFNPAEVADSDNDGLGNNEDLDDDNDGVADTIDAFPFNPAEVADNDNDGIGNNEDTDDDNDGVADIDDEFPLDPTQSMSEVSKLNYAIKTGNPAFLPEDRVLIETRILDEIQSTFTQQQSFLQQIYADNAVEYNPTRNSSYFTITELKGTYPLVLGNKGENLAVATQVVNQNNVAFGHNILLSLNDGNNAEFAPAMVNILAWLLKREKSELDELTNVRFVMVDNTTFIKSKNWLNGQFPNWDIINCNDAQTVELCATEQTDLLITSASSSLSDTNIAQLMFKVNENKIPKMYVHTNSWNTSTNIDVLMAYFSMQMPARGAVGNYFSQDKALWNNFEDMLTAGSKTQVVKSLINRFTSNSFDFDLASCEQGYWHDECDNITEYQKQLDAPLVNIRVMMKSLDNNKIDVFKEEGYILEKLLVLLGDHYRQDVSFPMDKTDTSLIEFARSLFADSAVMNVREFNPVQKDMGTFSRSDFSHITAVDKVVELSSKPDFRSAGVYALPGQTMKITRLDTSELNTKVFINSLRLESTLEFNEYGYSRPNYLQSTAIPINSGETIYMTSPYGGPVQISFDQKDLAVSFKFENIGEHPYWNDESDNEQFDVELNKGDYDWAEVATPGFEVHSSLEKMRSTLENPNWNTGALLSAATMQYLHNNPYRLAGFQGPGIKPIDEVNDFAQSKGFTIKTLDRVQHMNADQASCGGGCSGNPYDAFWAFNPIGHGDIHELGHGLENNRFKFNNSQSHATTNFYSYYSKFKFYENTGQDGSCKNKPFNEMLSLLQESKTKADPFTFMQNAIDFSQWIKSPTIMIELMMAAQQEGDLQEGWNIIPMMHILAREFDVARKSDESWDIKKYSLGFSQYSREQADNIDNNDFLLIVVGYISQLNLTNYFNMWGLETSANAKSQVTQAGFKLMPTTYYLPEVENGYCYSLTHPSINI